METREFRPREGARDFSSEAWKLRKSGAACKETVEEKIMNPSPRKDLTRGGEGKRRSGGSQDDGAAKVLLEAAEEGNRGRFQGGFRSPTTAPAKEMVFRKSSM